MTPSCPVCASHLITQRATMTSDEAAQHFVLREELPERHESLRSHIEGLWHGKTCALMSCDACDFGFAWPYVAGDDCFYNLAYPTVGYPGRKWEFERTLVSLDRTIIRAGKALEIGAGFGYFLGRISPRLVAPEVILAVEYNEECQRVLKEKGYHVLATDVRSDEFLQFEAQFDVIFIFQVLEHMDGLDALMRRLKFLLRPDGRIFIAVPNGRQIAFSEAHGGLSDMPPNHIGRWSVRAFQHIADRIGFAVVETGFEPFGLVSFIKTDVTYRYLRRAQVAGTIANRIRSLKRGRTRRLLEYALLAAYTPTRLVAWKDAWDSRHELGDSLWVHLRSANDEAA